MPELTPARRGAGPKVTREAIDPASPLPWRNGTFPPLPTPDQSRYGRATTDPLGRDGPGWFKGKDGLPKLRNGWQYDPLTHRTTPKPEKPSATHGP